MNRGRTSVYRYFNSRGRLLYVGVTCRGTKRMNEHAATKEWWPLAVTCKVEHFATRDEALAREAALISRHQPPFNTAGKARPSRTPGAWVADKPPGAEGPCLKCETPGTLSSRGLCRSCEGQRGRREQKRKVA